MRRSDDVYNFMRMIEPYVLKTFDYKLKFPFVNTTIGRIPINKKIMLTNLDYESQQHNQTNSLEDV